MSDVAESSPVPAKNRIDELESIRGIAALLVVLYHIPNWNAQIYDLAILRNSYLMVELFFVLSGFVIYKAYANNIHTKENLFRFQFLRFGRLYPVHLLFLGVFLLLEIAKWFADTHYGIKSSRTTPFVENSWTAFVQHLFLIQAIGPTGNALTFNAPAWSISVEFYTYLIFALITLYFGRFKLAVFATVAIVACYMLGLEAVHTGYSDLLRCLAGFFIGCCTAKLSEVLKLKLPSHAVTLMVVLLAVFLVYKQPKQYDIVIYFLTAMLVLAIVFSENGLIKNTLRLRFFTWLGMISYSVYMSHSALLWLFNQVHRFMFKRPEIWFEGRLVPQLSVTETIVSYVVILTLLLLVSNVVYHIVEKPFREKSRKVVFKMPAVPLSVSSTK